MNNSLICFNKHHTSTSSTTKERPLVSIITVVYNAEEYLEKTIQSVIGQTYENIEYIIIDGGSSDGTLDIIKRYEHAIDYWVSEKDEGIYDAMNKGIEAANGEWINFMNGGDSFFEDTVLERLFAAKYLNEVIVYGKVAMYYKDTFLSEYGNRNIYPHQAIFVKTIYLKNMKFDTTYKIGADNEFLSRLRAMENFNSFYVDCIVAKFQLGGVGNHPKYLHKTIREEYLIRKKNKKLCDLKWFITLGIQAVGSLLFHLFGERFYYLVFQKNFLKLIQAIKKSD